MEETIELLEIILEELKSWEHEPRPVTVETLSDLTKKMYNTIYG